MRLAYAEGRLAHQVPSFASESPSALLAHMKPLRAMPHDSLLCLLLHLAGTVLGQVYIVLSHQITPSWAPR